MLGNRNKRPRNTLRQYNCQARNRRWLSTRPRPVRPRQRRFRPYPRNHYPRNRSRRSQYCPNRSRQHRRCSTQQLHQTRQRPPLRPIHRHRLGPNLTHQLSCGLAHRWHHRLRLRPHPLHLEALRGTCRSRGRNENVASTLRFALRRPQKHPIEATRPSSKSWLKLPCGPDRPRPAASCELFRPLPETDGWTLPQRLPPAQPEGSQRRSTLVGSELVDIARESLLSRQRRKSNPPLFEGRYRVARTGAHADELPTDGQLDAVGTDATLAIATGGEKLPQCGFQSPVTSISRSRRGFKRTVALGNCSRPLVSVPTSERPVSPSSASTLVKTRSLPLGGS
jgi:hypothetical protein